MRPITRSQWNKMPPRSKSWLVAKAFGFQVHVFWHLTRDGSQTTQFGGSYSDEDQTRRLALRLVAEAPEQYPVVVVRRDLSFWSAAEYWQPAKTVIDEMLKRGWRCSLHFMLSRTGCQFRKVGTRTACTDEKPELAICAAALHALGYII